VPPPPLVDETGDIILIFELLALLEPEFGIGARGRMGGGKGDGDRGRPFAWLLAGTGGLEAVLDVECNTGSGLACAKRAGGLGEAG
jgi:hypothetical protein